MEKYVQWKTKINPKSKEFIENYDEMKKVVADLDEKLKETLYQGPEKMIMRYKKKGKLLARERVELLLDEDSPFMELCCLAGYGIEGTSPGASIVAGIGLVSGVECMISASVYTIKGGSVNEITAFKAGRIAQIATENRLPLINMTQSAGADLTQQGKVFHKGGAGFRNLARRSKEGIPSITVVFGSSTAGGAYTPGMSDYVIMVKNEAKVYLGGPPLVKMATGEEVDHEELGGADMHSRVSGVSDYLAHNEHEAIKRAREIVASLNYKKRSKLPKENIVGTFPEEPVYSSEELLGIARADVKQPYDMREIIARIVDGSRFHEFKPLYGNTLVTCWAKVHGFPVGILANNGVLFAEAANKGTQFIQLCNQKHTPLIFIHNITGFMVGKKYEQEGIIKAGSRFISAVSCSEVPAISLIAGASYGAGNYGMCGRAYEPRFIFSWPQAKCSVMGPDQLGGVLDIIMREAAARAGRQVDEGMAEARKQMLRSMVEEESTSYWTTARCIDDNIIDPRETRNMLGFALSVIHTEFVKGGNLYGVHRM